MKLEEIEKTLPNGFHDAHINSINIDYTKRQATLSLDIWVSETLDQSSDEFRPAYLTLSDLIFCVIEPPDAQSQYIQAKPLWIDAQPMNSSFNSSLTNLPKSIPSDAFLYWFFVNNWNAFIYIAAMDAKLSFVD